MTIGTKIYTFFCGNFVGEDEFGNRYYCNQKSFDNINSKRWVLFHGSVEATKVPPHWHAWLHKTVDKPPIDYAHKYDWQKDHTENLTGTENAYFPDTHPLSKSSKVEKSETYEKWNP